MLNLPLVLCSAYPRHYCNNLVSIIIWAPWLGLFKALLQQFSAYLMHWCLLIKHVYHSCAQLFCAPHTFASIYLYIFFLHNPPLYTGFLFLCGPLHLSLCIAQRALILRASMQLNDHVCTLSLAYVFLRSHVWSCISPCVYLSAPMPSACVPLLTHFIKWYLTCLCLAWLPNISNDSKQLLTLLGSPITSVHNIRPHYLGMPNHVILRPFVESSMLTQCTCLPSIIRGVIVAFSMHLFILDHELLCSLHYMWIGCDVVGWWIGGDWWILWWCIGWWW